MLQAKTASRSCILRSVPLGRYRAKTYGRGPMGLNLKRVCRFLQTFVETIFELPGGTQAAHSADLLVGLHIRLLQVVCSHLISSAGICRVRATC